MRLGAKSDRGHANDAGVDDQRGGEAVTPGVDGNGELANAEELAELARLVREEFIHEMSILELP